MRVKMSRFAELRKNTNRTTRFYKWICKFNSFSLQYILKYCAKRGEIAHQEQFLLLFIIFCYRMIDFYVKTRTRFSLRYKRLFEIIEAEITRVDCI